MCIQNTVPYCSCKLRNNIRKEKLFYIDVC